MDFEKALDMPLDDIIAATLNGTGAKSNNTDKSFPKNEKKRSAGGGDWIKSGYTDKDDWKGNKKGKWAGDEGAGGKWDKNSGGGTDTASWGWKKPAQDWGNKAFSAGANAGGWGKQDNWTSSKSKDTNTWGSGGGAGGGKTWWQEEEQHDRRKNPNADNWQSGGNYEDGQKQLRRRTKADQPTTPGRYDEGPKSVKVTNVPLDLDWRDIKDAFEVEAGKIQHCELIRGIATLRFTSAEDAKRAVKMFDRGELNGRTIHVELGRE